MNFSFRIMSKQKISHLILYTDFIKCKDWYKIWLKDPSQDFLYNKAISPLLLDEI